MTLEIRADRCQPIRSHQVDGQEGLFVTRDGFTGWDDGPDVRREALERPGEDGEFDLPAYSGARVVSVAGVALAHSLRSLGVTRSDVTGIGVGGVRFKVAVDHKEQNLWAWGRRGGRPEFKDTGLRARGDLRARFYLQWVFPDPRKYGVQRVTEWATSVNVVHRGNAPVSPVVEVRGPFPNGYAINAAGRTLRVGAPLAAGSTDRIEIASSRLFRNGARLLGAITTPGRWAVPGEARSLHTITSTGGTGQFRTLIYDAFE